MLPCNLTIVTSADGKESTFSQNAKMELSPLSAILCYNQSDACVCIRLEKGQVFIERRGDYTLRLTLAEGETRPGAIGLSDAEGKIMVTTHRIGYTIKERSFLLSMKYTLHFDGGSQEMKIRLVAREK